MQPIEISGILGTYPNGTLVPGGLEAQTTQALENLKLEIEKSGYKVEDLTGIDALITSRLLLGYQRVTKQRGLTQINKMCISFERAYSMFFAKNLPKENLNYLPARTLVEVFQLPIAKERSFSDSTRIPRIELKARLIPTQGQEHHILEVEAVSSPETYSSQAVVVDLGDKLYLETSALLPRQPFPSHEGMASGSIFAQPRQCWDNISYLLHSVNGTSEHITNLTVYQSDEIKELTEIFFKNRYPIEKIDFVKVVDIPKKSRYRDKYFAVIAISARAEIPK